MRPDPTVASAPSLIWLREEPCSRNPGLSRDRIAAAAVALADEEGFEALSMRRVAERLEVGTMSLYHYVDSKDELVTLMFNRVMGEILIPAGELPSGWRAATAAIAESSLEAMRRHRWMLDRLGEGRPTPNGLRHFEQSLEAMGSLADVPQKRLFEAIVLVDEYVFGFAIREAAEADHPKKRHSADAREFLRRQLDGGELPRIRDFFGDDVDTAMELVETFFREEGRFQRGLEQLLDGIEAALARA
jgi:AcrR family transcriptional regulator